ncbi:MAG: hypothetical protein QXO17_00370 [Nitrososphaerota archaeon]
MKAGIVLLVVMLLVIGSLTAIIALQNQPSQPKTTATGETIAFPADKTATSPGTVVLRLIARLEGPAIPLWSDGGFLYLAHGVIEGPNKGRIELVRLDLRSGSVSRIATLRDDWYGQVYLHLALGQPIRDEGRAYFLMENMQLVKVVDLASGEVSTVDRRGSYLYFIGAWSGVLYARDSTAGDVSLVALDLSGKKLWRSPKVPLVLKDPYQHILFAVRDGPKYLLLEAHGFEEMSGGWYATPTLVTVFLSPDGGMRIERVPLSGELGPMPAVSSGGWAVEVSDGYYILAVFGPRVFLCRLGVDLKVKWCNDLGEYKLDDLSMLLLHPLKEGILVGIPYQIRANTTYEAYMTRIRIAFYGPDGRLLGSSEYTPNSHPFYFRVVGEHGGYLYVLMPTGKQFIDSVSQGTLITLARIDRGGRIDNDMSVKDVLAAEFFRGEDPWSYRFSDDVRAIIVNGDIILICGVTVKDRFLTYIVDLKLSLGKTLD